MKSESDRAIFVNVFVSAAGKIKGCISLVSIITPGIMQEVMRDRKTKVQSCIGPDDCQLNKWDESPEPSLHNRTCNVVLARGATQTQFGAVILGGVTIAWQVDGDLLKIEVRRRSCVLCTVDCEWNTCSCTCLVIRTAHGRCYSDIIMTTAAAWTPVQPKWLTNTRYLLIFHIENGSPKGKKTH